VPAMSSADDLPEMLEPLVDEQPDPPLPTEELLRDDLSVEPPPPSR
jgi:hypothetical protein